jgi:hypothetical protein
MAIYKLVKNHPASIREGKEVLDDIILKKAENMYISKDPANRDYQEYLEWVDAGNTPEAAD